MRRSFIGLVMATLVMARPELYKEKEDFQYSRSSSDEGRKSGFYDAQRGNMGGNYERAHNMDGLAQHQMGGLVRQVEGELGDASKTRTGSVFSSANSRGVYGSGHYDLSNLAGRNFQEGASYGDTQYASSSLTNSAAHNAQSSSINNARYSTSGHALNSNYRGYEASDLQGTQNLYNANQFDQGMQAGSSRYHSQFGYEGQNSYQQHVSADQLAAQNMDATHHHRLISTVPVKIIVRPGQRIAVPIATQTHSGSQIASYYDQNAINSDAEALSLNVNQQAIKPSSTAKHYESSYKYEKEWEKHDTKPAVIPLSIPTAAPIPKNSELYDDSYAQRAAQYSGNDKRYEHNSNFNSASSQSQHQTDFNAQHLSSSLSNSNLNAYAQTGADSKLDSQSANLFGSVGSKPKSYQSSYSYHKSWERQGDPYIIKPASNGAYEAQTSGKLTDASASDSQSAYAYNYGSRRTENQQRYSLSNNCMIECEPSHSRVARSYNSNHAQFEQQSEKLEDLGQQTQNKWDNLSDLGQQTQDQWTLTDNFGQETQSENFEDLGQQTQNQWDNLADLGQQTQDQWTQNDNFEQQSLNKEHLEDLGQQTQNKWDSLADLGQQTQDTFGHLEDLGQQVQTWDTGSLSQHTQSQSENTENIGQQTQNKWNENSTGQQTENKIKRLEDLAQQTQTKWDSDKAAQQIQSKLEQFGQSQMHHGQQTEFGQKSENKWHQINGAEMDQSQVTTEKSHLVWDTLSVIEQNQYSNFNQESMKDSFQQHDINQQTSGIWNNDQSVHGNSQAHSKTEQNQTTNTSSLSNLWGKLDNLDDDYTQYNGNSDQSNFSQSSSSHLSSQSWHQEQSFHPFFSDKEVRNKDFATNVFKQVEVPEKSPIMSDDHKAEVEYDKFTTPKGEAADKNNQPDQFQTNDKQTTTTTQKAQDTLTIRPADIGRGDIGPEESLLETSSKKTTYGDFTSNKEVSLNESIKENSNKNLNKHSVSDDKNVESSTALVTEEITKELVRPLNMPQPWETQNKNSNFEQNNGYGQDSQQFIESMKNFESINSQQHDTEQLSTFSQQNTNIDQQIDWNAESQNVQQQFVNDFSEQSQEPVQSFDQQFMNFGQQYDTTEFEQQQQMDKEINPAEFMPEEMNLHKGEKDIEQKVGRSNDWKSNEAPNSELVVQKPKININQDVSSPEEKEPNKKTQNEETPISESVTENPGFWKSVGSKLSNVKNKVTSWFGS